MQGTGQTSNRIVMVYLEPCTGDNDPSFKLGPGFLRATYSQVDLCPTVMMLYLGL